MTKIQSSLLTNIKSCIDSGYTSMKTDETIKAMSIVDHTRWDPSNKEYGMEEIETITKHFEEPLKSKNYVMKSAKEEFVKLKVLQQKR